MNETEYLADSAIRATLAACSQAGDARKADAYAASFTEDGILDLGDPRLASREAIRAWMTAPSVIPQPGAEVRAPGYVSHHLTTCRIDLLSETEAKVRTYWLVITAKGLDHSGYYDDRFRKDGDAWLIARRKPRTLWTSETSLVAAR